MLEGFPPQVFERLKEYHAQLAKAQTPTHSGLSFNSIVLISRRWNPGETVTVAFKGGDLQLWQQIATATDDWTKNANIKLDFGFDPKNGSYRQWTTSDTRYQADIRISFDQVGYYSFIGTESIDPGITKPGQESMNFQGFDKQLPYEWRGVVLHEFGHALGFEHEHQQPEGGCDFRWNPDPGYVLTTDENKSVIPDPQGRRPSIYQMLEGPPNNWDQEMIDANLRRLPDTNAFDKSVMDKYSIMEYYFPDYMFVAGDKSPCYLEHENIVLSPLDIVGVKRAYPFNQLAIQQVNAERMKAMDVVQSIKVLDTIHKQSMERSFDLQ